MMVQHISKVRSIELDDWNDEQIGQMRGGNLKAREYWEATRPPGIVVNDSSVRRALLDPCVLILEQNDHFLHQIEVRRSNLGQGSSPIAHPSHALSQFEIFSPFIDSTAKRR